MKIFVSFGALLALLVIAFLIGIAVGTQMTATVVPAPGQHLLSGPGR